MGIPAWQVRVVQRQELVQMLRDDIFRDDATRDDPKFLFQVHTTLVPFLHTAAYFDVGSETFMITQIEKYVQITIIPRINVFARTIAERQLIVLLLAEEVFKEATSRIRGAVLSEEIHKPAEILQAGTATEEVQLEEYLLDDPKT